MRIFLKRNNWGPEQTWYILGIQYHISSMHHHDYVDI